MFSEGLLPQEFADLCGVSKDTLLYYDKIGLFHPAYIADNGYRLYCLDQVHTFDLLLMLRDSHVPLKQIKNYLQDRNPEKMLNLLNEQLKFLNRELYRLQELCQRLDFTSLQVERGMKSCQREPEIQQLEEKLYIAVPVRTETLYDRKRRMTAVRDFLRICQTEELQGDYLRCAMISKERLKAGCYDKEFFGIHTTAPVKKELPNISTIKRPSGYYAVLRHYGGYKTLPESYDKLISYIEKEGWTICGYAYETELIGYICVQDDLDYVIEIAIEVNR